MPCCLFYCHLASQLDPKPFKRGIVFWFSSAKKELTVFVSEIKRVENYPYFENLVDVIQNDLQGFIDKNIESESTEANNLSHILKKCVCCVNNSKLP